MADQHRDHHADEALEQRLGTYDALYALWAPERKPMAVTLDDSSIITASADTRSRLLQVHSVVHAVLRGEHDLALRRLADMSSLLTVFTALRSLTLSSELLWSSGIPTWRTVLANADDQLHAIAACLTGTPKNEARHGADTIHDAIWRNLTGHTHERVLDCVAGIARSLSSHARLGLGAFGAAVHAAALRATSGRDMEKLVEEHAALLTALARGQAVTHRDGRLQIDE